MTNDEWSLLRRAFEAGWSLDEAGRQALLDEICAGDARLQSEAAMMLKAYDAERRAQNEAERRLKSHKRRFGAWETVHLLGRGGMAEVWLAHRVDGQHDQRAALKLISPYLTTPEFNERFRRERQLLARLEHPNIPRVLDGGTSEAGEPYLVMEYIEGRPLDEYCDAHKLDARARVRLTLHLCSAVASAHRNLILHRDIKPSNVLVTPDGAVKLVDFGTAREVSAGSLETRAPITPAYASPEQLRGEPVTTLSDVYGVGATLYRLVAGVAPFDSDDKSPYAAMQSVLEAELLPPSAAPGLSPDSRREIRGDLDNIVRKATEKNPARRYSSVEQLSSDLERYLEKRPVTARPLTWTYRAERFLARNRLRAAFAAVLAGVLLGSSIVLGWQVQQVRREARRNARLTEFLTRMMGLSGDSDFSPMREQGLSTRMIDVIRYVAEKLDDEIGDQPLSEARLSVDLGRVLGELGHYDEADRVLTRGLELTDRHKDPALAAELLGYLGRSHELQGMIREPVGEFEEALRLMGEGRKGMPKHEQVVLLIDAEGLEFIRHGYTPEAKSMLHDALVLASQVGEQSPTYAGTLALWSDVLMSENRIDEAEQSLERAMAIHKRQPYLPLEYDLTLNELGNLRMRQSRLDEAEAFYAQARALEEKTRGRKGLNYQYYGLAKGMILYRRGDFAGAAAYFEQLAREVADALPRARWIRAMALRWQGATLLKLDRNTEARQLLHDAMTMAHEELGDRSPLTADIAAVLKQAEARASTQALAR